MKTEHNEVVEREGIRDRIAGPRVSVPRKIIDRLKAYRAAMPYDPVLSQIEIDLDIALEALPARDEAVPASGVEAKCETCNGHGLVGGWRVGDGYDAEPCPDCTLPKDERKGYISADNGQGMGLPERCTRYHCGGEIRYEPTVSYSDNGDNICAKCGTSYGSEA